jgi:hypothetical protein
MSKGLLVFVLRPANRNSQQSPSDRIHQFVLTGDGIDGPFEPSENAPELRLVRRKLSTGEYLCAAPPDYVASRTYISYMASGNFVYSSDSRFSRVCNYPVAIHDRRE